MPARLAGNYLELAHANTFTDEMGSNLFHLIAIYICVKYSIDPDNVAAPLAAALGDFFVLLVMTLVGLDAINSSQIKVKLEGTGGSITTNPKMICQLVDFFVHVSGWILASYVNLLPSLPRLQPPINGVGGNLASILISRMTTRLSIVSKPMITEDIIDQINAATLFSFICIFSSYGTAFNVLAYKVRGHGFDAHRCTPSERNGHPHWLGLATPESSVTRSDSDEDGTLEKPRPVDSLKATEMAVTQAISDSNTSACGLLTLCLPLHSMLLVINHIISSLFHESSGSNAFSISVILAYLAAGFLQVFVLLLFARLVVLRRWLSLARHQQQQVSANTRVNAGGLAALDLTGIAVTTGLGDFLGTAFLATFLRFAEGS
ncbi:hypothetical protein ACTXT7_009669 [Hymenolepis weldensis]